MRCVTFVVLLACAAPHAQAQEPPGHTRLQEDSASVHAALTRFLSAFENLDWDAFRSAFSDSASVFHPAPSMGARVAGQNDVERSFSVVFADIKAAAQNGPPYHRLDPEDLHILRLGPDAFLLSFQLRNAERLARRTVIMRRETVGWRIVHLHASNMAK
jgi:ketosteroid isomerase-like protein